MYYTKIWRLGIYFLMNVLDNVVAYMEITSHLRVQDEFYFLSLSVHNIFTIDY